MPLERYFRAFAGGGKDPIEGDPYPPPLPLMLKPAP